jgi:hypothetical protein
MSLFCPVMFTCYRRLVWQRGLTPLPGGLLLWK